MELKTRTHGRLLLAVPQGEICWNTCGPLHDRLVELVGEPEPLYQELWVDMDKVTLVDSVGLGALLGVKVSCHRLGVQFNLMRPSDEVKRMLSRVKFDTVLKILDYEDAKWRAPELFEDPDA